MHAVSVDGVGEIDIVVDDEDRIRAAAQIAQHKRLRALQRRRGELVAILDRGRSAGNRRGDALGQNVGIEQIRRQRIKAGDRRPRQGQR